MRYRGAHRVPEWLEKGAPIFTDARENEHLQAHFQALQAPISMEIGCGRGGFLRQMASIYRDVYFIGVDKVMSVVSKAAADAVDHKLGNIEFMLGDIEEIAPHIASGRIHRLFLNFSDPWPRNRHIPRRLTHQDKLRVYARLLDKDGVLEHKTDNREFFDWSVPEFQQAGWILEEVQRGFEPAEPDPGHLSSQFVQTEYEQKFRAQGVEINYLRARPPKP